MSIPVECQAGNAEVAELMDAMTYDCNEDGTFKRLQCYGFLEHCWCVDPLTSDEIDDTRMRSSEFNLDCDKGGMKID